MKDDDPEIILHDLDGSREVVPAASKQSWRQVKAAVALKISGASYADIATTLDYVSPAAARAAVEQGLADSYDSEDTASLRRITSARLEGLWRLAWRKAQATRPKMDEFGDEIPGLVEDNTDQAKYIRLGMDISGRYAKLHGLDAPTQIQVSPTANEFTETIGVLVAASRRALPTEADIFADEEIVDAEIEVGPEDEPTDG